jgi:hypothetical protein
MIAKSVRFWAAPLLLVAIITAAIGAATIVRGVMPARDSGRVADDPNDPGVSSEKKTLTARDEQERADALTRGVPTSANPEHRLRTPTPEAWPTGIREHPNPRDGNIFENSWQNDIDGVHVQVFAGSDRRDRTQGVVEVNKTSMDYKPLDGGGVFRTGPDGPLRIASEKGNRVRIVSAKGEEFEYDASTDTFSTLTTPCCTLQLDLNSKTAGVQPSVVLGSPGDVSIDVVFGNTASSLASFNFKLVYDDTRMAPVDSGASELDGNPDLNDAVLGKGWSCSLPAGSGTPDIDPEKGPGRGVAFLSCYTTGATVNITGSTVVATLRMHVTASGTTSVDITEATFARPDGTELGSCNPVVVTEMTCVGGSAYLP